MLREINIIHPRSPWKVIDLIQATIATATVSDAETNYIWSRHCFLKHSPISGQIRVSSILTLTKCVFVQCKCIKRKPKMLCKGVSNKGHLVNMKKQKGLYLPVRGRKKRRKYPVGPLPAWWGERRRLGGVWGLATLLPAGWPGSTWSGIDPCETAPGSAPRGRSVEWEGQKRYTH